MENRSRLLRQGVAHANLATFFIHAKYFAELEAHIAQLRAEGIVMCRTSTEPVAASGSIGMNSVRCSIDEQNFQITIVTAAFLKFPCCRQSGESAAGYNDARHQRILTGGMVRRRRAEAANQCLGA